MRKLEYLSPTSIQLYWTNPEDFYLNYLADNRIMKPPQTKPMSIGSAFDAYVKSFLHEALFGKGKDVRFDLTNLFEAQVEKQNRSWAWEHGKYIFEQYKDSGALSDLMIELSLAVGEPRFEIEVKGVVNGYRDGVSRTMQDSIILLGKPDVFYTNKEGNRVILDWKVNGYCSDYTTSPMPGYIRIRNGGINSTFSRRISHKDAVIRIHKGMMINIGHYLETLKQDWAIQLAIYGWLVGELVGADFTVAIDQIVCKKSDTEKPIIRIAEHRLRIGQDFQMNTFAKIIEFWKIINSEPFHYFHDLSFEDSLARCQLLDQRAATLIDETSFRSIL